MKIRCLKNNKKIILGMSSIAMLFLIVITVSLIKINNNQVYSLEAGEKECVTSSGENSTVCYAVESFSFPINPDFTKGTVSGLTKLSSTSKTCLAGTDTMNMATIASSNIVRVNNYSSYLPNLTSASDRAIVLGYFPSQWPSGKTTGDSIIANASRVLYLNSTDSDGKTYCLPNSSGTDSNIAYLFEPDVGWNLPHKFYARTTNSNGEDEIYISYCLQESFASPAHFESGNTPRNKTIPSLTKLSESEYKAINTKYPTRNYDGLSTKTISSTSIDKVINIITNGYPGSTNYWYKKGFCGTSTSNGGPSSECEDAMFAATQTAIWYVLQGEPGNEDEDTILKNLKNNNYLILNATAFDIVGMARKLINNASGDANTGELALGKLSEPSVSVSNISISTSDSNFVATFTVTAKDLDPGYNLTFSGVTGGITVKKGQTTITAKDGVYSVKNTTDSTDTITVEFSKCGNYNKTLSVSVEALGTNSEGLVYFTDNYDSSGNVITGTHNGETRPIQQTIGMQVISVATGDTKTKTATTPNEPISVTFTKTGSVTGTTYGNTSWAIYTDKTVAQTVANNSGSTAGTTPYATFSTDQDGRATVSNLYRNTDYFIVETSVPAGLSLTNKVYEFKADDTCSTSSSQTYSLKDPEWYIGLKVIKKQEGVTYKTGEATGLTGATFVLQEWSEATQDYVNVGDFTDNGDGTYSLLEYKIRNTENTITDGKIYYTEDNLGKFKIVETKAPYGFKVSYNDEIQITAKNNKQIIEKDAIDEPIPIEVTVEKKGSATGISIPGTKWAVYEDDKDSAQKVVDNNGSTAGTKPYATFTIDKDGTKVLDTFYRNHTYYLVETDTPDGYNLSRQIYNFTFSQDFAETFSTTLTNEEWYIYLNLTKKQQGVKYIENAKTGLSGGKYELQEWSEATQDYVKVGDFTDNGDGTYSLLEYTIRLTGKKITDGKVYYTYDNKGKFKVVETEAPFGLYTVFADENTNFKEITITKDDNKRTVEVEAVNPPIPIEVTFNKVGIATATSFAGTQWAVYEDDKASAQKVANNNGSTAGTTPYATFTIGENGTKVLDTFYRRHTYYIVETSAPDGINLNKTVYEYSFPGDKKENEISVIHEDEEWYLRLKIIKKQQGLEYAPGELTYLTGAVFELQEWSKKTQDYVKVGVFTDNEDGTYYLNEYTDRNTGKTISDGKIYYTEDNEGKFRAVEKQAPFGFYTTFSEDIQITKDNNEKTLEMDAINPPIPLKVTFDKIGTATATSFAGTQWAVYENKDDAQKVANNNGSTVGTTPYATFTIGENGTKVLDTFYRRHTYYIVETSVPDGINLNNEVYEYFFPGDASEDQNFTHKDDEWSLGLTIIKKETGVEYKNNITNLTGATFKLYEWSEKEGNYKQVGTLKDNGTGTYSVYNYRIRSTGELLSTDKVGKIYYTEDNLGKFKVVETKAPFGLIPTYEKEFVIGKDNKDTAVIDIAYDDPVLFDVTLTKEDIETVTAQGDATLDGAVYKIYAASDIYAPGNRSLYSTDQEIAQITLKANGKEVATGEFKDLYPGDYYIVEVKPPEGYLPNTEKIYVHLEIPSDYYPSKTQTEHLTSTSKTADQVIKQAIQIDKMTDEETPAKPLEGVGFTFYSVTKILEKNNIDELPYNVYGYVDIDALDLTGCEVVTGENGETELFTNADGKLRTIELPYAKYLTVETTPNPYYSSKGGFVFNIPVYDSGESGYNYKDFHEFNVINTPYKAYVKVIKLNSETGKAIPQSGVTFKIKDSEGNYVTQTYSNGSELVKTDEFVTNDGGYLMTYTPLNAGKYYLEEVIAPKGFVKYEGLLEFEITASDDESIVTIEVTNDPTTVELYKLQEYKDIKVEGYEYVAGATLTIYYADEDGNALTDNDGNNIVFKYTDETGKYVEATWITGLEPFIIKQMPIGNYILSEVATPTNSGYITSVDVPFTVKATSDVQQVTMLDDHTKVSFKKIDSSTGNTVAGALLQLEDEDGKIIDKWTTTDEPYVIENILVPGKTYKLVELEAPDGYGIDVDGITFTVEDKAEQTIEFLNSPIPDVPDTSKTSTILIIFGTMIVAVGTVLIAMSRKLKLTK